MSKNLLNYYRYRRKWGRKIEQVKHEFADDPKGIHRDFAWQSRKRNPYAHSDPRASIKRRIALSLIVICMGGMAVLMLFHPFFSISQVSVEGAERLPAQEIKNAVEATISYKKVFLFPARNFFLVDIDEIRDVLKSRFPLSMVSVTKTFPHHILITVHEKTSTIIYDNGKQYSYVGLDGKIVEVLRAVGNDEWVHEVRTVTSTQAGTTTLDIREEIISSRHVVNGDHVRKEFGNHPVVYDMRQPDGGVNTEVLHPETVRGVVAWYQMLSARAKVQLGYVEIKDELGDAVIYMNDGWFLRVKLRADIDAQFDALMLVLEKNAIQGSNYIDVRYSGKVYVQ